MLLLGLLKVLLTMHSMLLGLFVMQDLAFDYCYLAESFETSVPWSRSVFIIISYLPVNTYTHSLTKPPLLPPFPPFTFPCPFLPLYPPPPSPSPPPLSLPRSRVLELCRNVKDRVNRECEKHGVNTIKYPPLISARYIHHYTFAPLSIICDNSSALVNP